MNRVRLLVLVLTVVAGTIAAKERPRLYTYRPVSIAFLPGFSTNGVGADRVSSNFSLNIIGGNIGRVRGVELGGVFNIDADEVIGYQAAGAFNLMGGSFTGLQQAGAANIVGGGQFAGGQMAGAVNVLDGCFGGIQMAGAVNIVGGCLTGLQMAGAVNLAGSDVYGAQIAGAVNASDGTVWGAQVAGAANLADAFNGLQLSGAVNAADEFVGAQVGVVNIGGKGRGAQIGVVNIAEDVDVPIGLVSIVENGQFHVNLWAADFSLANVGIKAGSKYVYNVFMLGSRPGGDSTRLFAGLGIGGHIPMNRFFVDIDVLNHGVYTGPDWFEGTGPDLLSSLRVTAGWQLADMLALTAGPTFNVRVQDLPGSGEDVSVWPGFTVGLQLL